MQCLKGPGTAAGISKGKRKSWGGQEANRDGMGQRREGGAAEIES